MNLKTAATVLFLILSGGVRAVANDFPQYLRFTNEECELFLIEAESLDEDVRRKTAELADWLFFRHPVQRAAVLRSRDMKVKVDLLFLATGYLIPPKDRALLDHHKRQARFGFGVEWLSRSLLRDLTRTIGDQDDGDRKDRMTFLTDMMTISFYHASRLTENHHNPGGQRLALYEIGGLKFEPTIQRPDSLIFQKAEKIRVREMITWLENPIVRNELVRHMSARLKSLVTEQFEVYQALQDCTSPERFDRVLQKVSPVALAPSDSPEAIASRPTVDTENFVESREDLANRAISDFPFSTLHRDLQVVSSLINRNLAQIQRLREREVEPITWRRLLENSKVSPQIFGNSLDDVETFAFEVLARMRTTDASLVRLEGWLQRTNSIVSNLGRDEASIAGLSPYDQSIFAALVTSLPRHTEFMKGARASLELYRRRLLSRISILGDIKIQLGVALQNRIAQEKAPPPFPETPECQAIVNILNELAKGADDAASK